VTTLAPAIDRGGAPFDAHPVATLMLDRAGMVIAVNPAAQDQLGLTDRQLVGRRFGDIAPDFAGRDYIPSRAMRAFDVTLAFAGRTLALDILAETDEAGRTVVALLPGRTVDATRAAPAQPSTEGAAVILAHEIKNPLSGIRGAAQLIAGGTADTARFTTLICREVDRIAALIDRMEILSAQRSLDLHGASIFPLIRHALDIARAGFATDIPIEERHDPSLPLALLDDDALVQILLNLVKNAAEALAGREDPRIIVSTGYRHGHSAGRGRDDRRRDAPIMICVSDNGGGVPAAILPDLFRPFASGRSGGTGLGLALVDRLARDMGGTIEYARDEAEGLSHFRLMLARAG
jgi:two-component system nitrogen regulation sensor histidine kinase GlnL